jgi:hypothetical protein
LRTDWIQPVIDEHIILIFRESKAHSHSWLAYCVFSNGAEQQGDREIEVSPWEDVNQGIGATRSIRFVANLEVGGGCQLPLLKVGIVEVELCLALGVHIFWGPPCVRRPEAVVLLALLLMPMLC